MGWYAFTEIGNLITPWSYETITFKTKKDAIGQLTASVLDPRKHPRIERVKEGFYMYHSLNCSKDRRCTYLILDESKVDDYGYRELVNDFIEEMEV